MRQVNVLTVEWSGVERMGSILHLPDGDMLVFVRGVVFRYRPGVGQIGGATPVSQVDLGNVRIIGKYRSISGLTGRAIVIAPVGSQVEPVSRFLEYSVSWRCFASEPPRYALRRDRLYVRVEEPIEIEGYTWNKQTRCWQAERIQLWLYRASDVPALRVFQIASDPDGWCIPHPQIERVVQVFWKGGPVRYYETEHPFGSMEFEQELQKLSGPLS